jgi:very-short-patch-repair endonuclease
MKICDYGCEKEGKHLLKNGKICCSEKFQSCQGFRKKNSLSHTGHNQSIEDIEKRTKFTKIETTELCHLGCGNVAKYISYSGKLYCESSYKKCPVSRRNSSNGLKGYVKTPPKLLNDETKICSYCLEKIAKYQLNNGKYCCENSTSKCESIKIKNRKSNSGEKNGFFNKHHSEVSLEKMRNGHTGKEITPHRNKKISIANTGLKRSNEVKERQKQFMLNGGAKHILSFPVMGFKNNKEWMLNGGVSYLRSFIKKISKEELKLKELVQTLFPNCKDQFPVLRYFLDIAIPEYKIAIEFDGYYHFNCQENIDYHTNRRNKIMNEGWKFYRVTMFDKFPTLEEVKENIERLINDITTK